MEKEHRILQISLGILILGLLLPIAIPIFYNNQLTNEPYTEYYSDGSFNVYNDFEQALYGSFNLTLNSDEAPYSNDSTPIYQKYLIGKIDNNTITNTTYDFHLNQYNYYNISLGENYTFFIPTNEYFEMNITCNFDGDTEVNFNLTGWFVWIHWNESLNKLNDLYIIIPLASLTAIVILFIYQKKKGD